MNKLLTITIATGAATMLAGCLVISVEDDGTSALRDLPRGGQPTCQAQAYDPLIGVQEDEVDRDRLPQTFRIVCHDCQITMDHNPNRLTIQLDAQNKVASVNCG
ncbi:MAG: I78 family peptidase inhibitor [Caulobacterales bacterium]|jgi:hypothetical protein